MYSYYSFVLLNKFNDSLGKKYRNLGAVKYLFTLPFDIFDSAGVLNSYFDVNNKQLSIS